MEILTREKNINYQNLETLLSQGKWRSADEETADLMLKAMGKKSWGDVNSEDLFNFPLTNLRTIDQLWLKYSDGKFGFSVQKQIWIDCGGTTGKYDLEVAVKFADKNGWRKKDTWLYQYELNCDINAPHGHFPVLIIEREEAGIWSRVGLNDVLIPFLSCQL